MFSTNHSEIESLPRAALNMNSKVVQEFKGNRQKETNVSSMISHVGGTLQHLQRKMDRPGESVLISTQRMMY